jgi:hypothetical protein
VFLQCSNFCCVGSFYMHQSSSLSLFWEHTNDCCYFCCQLLLFIYLFIGLDLVAVVVSLYPVLYLWQLWHQWWQEEVPALTLQHHTMTPLKELFTVSGMNMASGRVTLLQRREQGQRTRV